MTMHAIDWAIVVGMVVVLICGALITARYARSVSGFLAAERCGGRYLICVATSMAQVGVISLVWFFEQNYEVAYTGIWWPLAEGPAMIIIAISGWVVYRFRQTRAMTLAQFFEMRYSRNFRVFAGLIAYFSGIINFGIFPAVGARFFMALCGLPSDILITDAFSISTFPLLMGILLGISLAFTFMGGQIAVMVTDFLQGSFANIVFAVVMVYLLLFAFRWDQVSTTLLEAPAGKSMVDPLDIGQQSHFNLWYFIIGVISLFYITLGWQGTQGYNCAARNPHEAKMANLLAGWRFRVFMLIVLVVPICVRTAVNHADFTEQKTAIEQNLETQTGGIYDDQEMTTQLRKQLRTPAALGVLLPTGLLGLWCAAMLAAFISTHDTYLHSWGVIFIQDVVLPFRRKPLTQRQHLRLLRASIFSVALFVFLFSMMWRPTQYVSMFLIITGAVFVGGAGAAIIGGLYWNRGTAAGAWTAMLTGSIMATVSVVVKQVPESAFPIIPLKYGWLSHAMLYCEGLLWHVRTNITGQELNFATICLAAGLYVVVSLLTYRKPFNLDRMLHRGQYRIEGDDSVAPTECKTMWEKLGFTKEFVGRDKLIAYVTLAWPLVWTAVFVAGTVYALNFDVSDEKWLTFWWGYTWFTLLCGIAVTIWFVIGGFMDLRAMFSDLRAARIDATDDGRVVRDDE
ncbi:MAG: sodium:solute symporter [Planctomycetes bacterium]|nr:sodium:solute symporter [Planctomycetota bacterium]